MAWGSRPGQWGAGEGGWNEAFRLCPSNSQANENLKTKKCTNQSLGLYSLIHLRTIASYRGVRGKGIVRSAGGHPFGHKCGLILSLKEQSLSSEC